MSSVTLKIGGEVHGGWKEVRIIRSLERVADAFELTLVDQWDRNLPRRVVRAGEPCELWYGNERVITGYVDEVSPEYDASSVVLSVAGRSKAGDLIDCSLTGKQFRKQTLLQIAKALADPFGITVTARTDVGAAFKGQVLEPGQALYQFLDELARIRAVRFVSTPDGNLEIVRTGTERAGMALVLGQNILKGSGTFSLTSRFSEYVTVSQQAADDQTWAGNAAKVTGKAIDKEVRHRPTVVQVDGVASLSDCKQRAEHARNQEWGRAQGVVYTVPTWSDGAALWRPNTLITVRDPYLGIDGDRLIVEARLLFDDKGERAELQVAPKEAFDLAELPEKNELDSGGLRKWP